MAFTKTPTTDTYTQVDVDIVREWNTRPGDPIGAKDENYVNCYIEVLKDRNLEDKRQFVVKRPGITEYYNPPVEGEIRGAYYWQDNKSILFSIDNDLYMYHTTSATLDTMSNVWTTTSGVVGFCTFLYDTGTVVAIATDGTRLYTVSTAGVTTLCTDVDLPSSWIPDPVFLDGYLFLAETNSGNIANSNLNDPLLWTSGDFITAEMEGDRIVHLSKINNYVVAFGSDTIEYFWDAGIATGSPLQRNPTPIKINKIVGGMAQYGNTLYYIGANVNGLLDVWMLRDFQIESVGNSMIRRYLSSLSINFTNEYKAFIVSCSGHTFYLLSIGTRTFVYDINERAWYRWAYQAGSELDLTNSVSLQTYTQVASIFTIANTSTFYMFDDSVYQDNGVNFLMRIITEPADFGTLNRKSMSRFTMVCDRPAASSSGTLYWSDDDYQTYSSGVAIELNQDLPSVTRLGSFRQRAFRFDYTDNYPLRIQKFQVNINKGRT